MIGWPPRDGRKLIAMFLLSGGGMALTVSAWRTTTLLASHSANNPWPLAYGLYGTLALLGLVLTSLGWVIGKTAINATLPGGTSFNSSGGEAEAAQTVADAAQDRADEVKQ